MKTWMNWLVFLAALLIFVSLTVVYEHNSYISEREAKVDKKIELWYSLFEEAKAEERYDRLPHQYVSLCAEIYDYTPEQQERVDELKSMLIDELEAHGVSLEQKNQ